MVDDKVNLEMLNKINKKLRRYTLESKLELFRKISHYLEYNIRNEDMKFNIFKDGVLPKKWFKHNGAHLFEIEYLGLVSTIAGEWDGPLEDLNSKNDLRSLIRWFRNYVSPFFHKDDYEKFDNDLVFDLLFLRKAHLQFRLQDYLLTGLYRHNYFFNFKNSEINVKKTFIDIFDEPFNEYLKLVSGLMLLSNKSYKKITMEQVKNNFAKGNIFSKQKVEEMIRNLSMDRETAISKYKEFKSSDERLSIYNYNPYRMKPILLKDSYLFLPLPRLMFSAITEGFMNYISFIKGNDFRRKFGSIVFENYIEKLLQDSSEIKNVIPEFEYKVGRDSWKSSDFILEKKGNLILLEVKATSPSLDLLTADFESYIKQLNKAYGIAITQCVKKEKHIRSNILTHEKLPKDINKIYYLVVTLEDFRFPVTDFLKENIINYCKEEGVNINKNRNFHVMSVQTLEDIIDKDEKDLIQFLEMRESEDIVFSTYPETSVERTKKMGEYRDYKFWNAEMNKLRKDLSNDAP